MSVTEIAVCKHRSGKPDASTEDHFKPTASSKKMEDPQFRPPRKTTLFPQFTGVAEWYAAGGGLRNNDRHRRRIKFDAMPITKNKKSNRSQYSIFRGARSVSTLKARRGRGMEGETRSIRYTESSKISTKYIEHVHTISTSSTAAQARVGVIIVSE